MGSGGSVQFQLTAEEAVDKTWRAGKAPLPKKLSQNVKLITLAHAEAIVLVFIPWHDLDWVDWVVP